MWEAKYYSVFFIKESLMEIFIINVIFGHKMGHISLLWGSEWLISYIFLLEIPLLDGWINQLYK